MTTNSRIDEYKDRMTAPVGVELINSADNNKGNDMSSPGYIYIMTNPGLPNMVKIGFAKDVESRRQQLSTTNVPYDYEIYATYETRGTIEDKKLHKLIDNLNPNLRVNKRREFFLMSPEEAFELLESIAIISGTKDKLKKVKINALKKQTIKKPPINFEKCGIPVGAELVYIEDPTVVVKVVSDRKVQYGEVTTSLSAITDGIKGYSTAGPSYFTYNGELLTDIAARTQWK